MSTHQQSGPSNNDKDPTPPAIVGELAIPADALAQVQPFHRLADYDPQSAHKDITQTVSHNFGLWRDGFAARGIHGIQVAIEGAIQCGFFSGPKESDNPSLPEHLGFKFFEEIDLSIRIPKTNVYGTVISPHDDTVKDVVLEVLRSTPGVKDAAFSDKFGKNGWGQEAPLSLHYAYMEVTCSKTGRSRIIELEICTQRLEETCEVSDHWAKLFSPQERTAQAAARNKARKMGDDAYDNVKFVQNEHAKFRLLCLFLHTEGTADQPVPTKFIRSCLQSWYLWAPDKAPGNEAPQYVKKYWEKARELIKARSDYKFDV
jgi:hypothetical protein